MGINPCRGCDERNAECHAKCEKYGAWKAKREDERLLDSKKRNEESILDRKRVYERWYIRIG